VNFTRCTLGLRTQRLQNLAKRFLGPVSASVYGALLQSLESKVRDVKNDTGGLDAADDVEKVLPVASVREVAELLDPDLDLGTTINGVTVRKPMANGTSKKRKGDQVNGDAGHDDSSGSDEDPVMNGMHSYADSSRRLTMIEAHLMLLSEHPKEFCRQTRPGAPNKGWQVIFPALADLLIDDELDAVIMAKYGRIPLRIIRLLRARGKIEEKEVAALAMMRVKDTREVLTEMQYQGLVEAQEVPKDPQRAPNKTTYLWHFSTPHVASLVLQQTYKAMSRTLQRLEVQRENDRPIIEKAQRSDIKGHEEKLEHQERVVLRAWREIEERLLTQVTRMDDVVCTLRDFSGNDTSMMN
jgi:DNA-directed RNA polymerase III subunit RPC3